MVLGCRPLRLPLLAIGTWIFLVTIIQKAFGLLLLPLMYTSIIIKLCMKIGIVLLCVYFAANLRVTVSPSSPLLW